MEAKFPNNYHLSIVIGPLFFWRISAKRIERLFGLNKIQNVRQMYEKFIQTKHLAVNFIQKSAHKYDLTSYYANIIVRLILQNHRP